MTTVEAPVLTSEPGAFGKLDDIDLVSAVRDGYDEAFEVFYNRYQGEVLSFCRHMLGSREDAEDAVQQTFLATYRQVHASSPPRHPRAWLYTVARNRCLTTLRARRETSSDAVEPSTEGLAEEVERRHELRELLSDVGRLPEDQRVALLLFELGALDTSEIAETIGCPPKKVKALVYQARTTLTHRAEARNARCAEIRQQLATLRGGNLNGRTFKHHLEICQGCAEYRDEVRGQRAALGLILPVIPLAAGQGGALGALGLGNGVSHASQAAHAGAAHTVSSGLPHFVPARLALHAGRPRIAALGALAAGAAAGLVLVTGGGERRHGSEPLVPPAQAAPAASAHAATKAATLVAHDARAAHRQPGASRVHKPHGRANRPAAIIPPADRKPPAGDPPSVPKTESPKRHVREAPPKSSAPAPGPTKPTPGAPTGSTPAPSPPPPAASCGPKGQGGGNAWGLCKGPDGLPPPAEEHRQGSGVPGGPSHNPGH